MRKLFAKGLVIIIDAALLVLADLIMKGSKRNGNFHGLHRDHRGRPAGAGHSLHIRRAMRHVHRRGRFIF
ncbi:MAG: hypothetical protein WBG50_06550 [Desulfomonilaceae bacterium]